MRTIRSFIAGDGAEGSQALMFISGSEMLHLLLSRVITQVDRLLKMCQVIKLAAQIGNAL
jgi:hypothetical protein